MPDAREDEEALPGFNGTNGAALPFHFTGTFADEHELKGGQDAAMGPVKDVVGPGGGARDRWHSGRRG